MMQSLHAQIAFFEDSGLAGRIRENVYLFPSIESVHVLAICLVVGSILAVDLRLLGVAYTGQPVSRITTGILPLTWCAFSVALASGSLLFISGLRDFVWVKRAA